MGRNGRAEGTAAAGQRQETASRDRPVSCCPFPGTPAPPAPVSCNELKGNGLSYQSREYAAALADFGTPRWLLHGQGWVLVRRVPAVDDARDASGPYPLFACRDWARLGEDLADLRDAGIVSLVLVTDPLAAPRSDRLRRLFRAVARPFKPHHVAELAAPVTDFAADHHRRHWRRFRRAGGTVAVCANPLDHLDDWCRLYAGLVRRHGITGPARFSRRSFRRQLALSGLLAVRAELAGRTVAMQLWLVDGDRAWYHLGAADAAGYRHGASHALMGETLSRLRERGVRRADLGAGAGLRHDPDDGLARFKAGWSNAVRWSWLCGAVLDPARYRDLCRRAGVEPEAADYFPAYRDPHRSRLVTGTAAPAAVAPASPEVAHGHAH